MAPKHHPTPLSGGDREALGKELGRARAMTHILALQYAEARAKGEALIRTADRLSCDSWNERKWANGDPPIPVEQRGGPHALRGCWRREVGAAAGFAEAEGGQRNAGFGQERREKAPALLGRAAQHHRHCAEQRSEQSERHVDVDRLEFLGHHGQVEDAGTTAAERHRDQSVKEAFSYGRLVERTRRLETLHWGREAIGRLLDAGKHVPRETACPELQVALLGWRVEFTVNYLPSVVDPEVVVEARTYAGIRRGLGDWRPQNGKFLVERIE